MEGDCEGHDIRQIDGTRAQCGKACYALDYCEGFLYILPAEKKFPHPPCYLKKKMCKTPLVLTALDISAYFKSPGKLLL